MTQLLDNIYRMWLLRSAYRTALLLGQLYCMISVEQVGQQIQGAIKLLNALHKLPDRYPVRIFKASAYLCFSCIMVGHHQKMQHHRLNKRSPHLPPGGVCSTPSKSVHGLQSIWSSRNLFQDCLASSKRIRTAKNLVCDWWNRFLWIVISLNGLVTALAWVKPSTTLLWEILRHNQASLSFLCTPPWSQ